MVLPNGQHVRFGPTSWDDEDNDKYTIPRTTSVSGVCHVNPEEQDETKWIWEECEDNINFDDLWFAVRGGGGGTWGVVTCVYLQLHEYRQLETVQNGIDYLDACIGGFSSPEHRDVIEVEWWNFYIEFMFDPTAVGVTEEESNRCSSSTYNYLFCYGEGSSAAYTSAWTRYIENKNQTLAEEAGIPISTINLVAGCSGNLNIYNDYSDLIIIKEGPNAGKANDAPSPGYASSSEADVNIRMPAKYILENRDTARELVLAYEAAPYCAFGGKAGYAQDRATSLSDAHRLGRVDVLGIHGRPHRNRSTLKNFPKCLTSPMVVTTSQALLEGIMSSALIRVALSRMTGQSHVHWIGPSRNEMTSASRYRKPCGGPRH